MKICPRCSASSPDNASYCDYCGYLLSAPAPDPADAPPEHIPVYPTVLNPVSTAVRAPRRKLTRTQILLIAIGIVALALTIVLLVLLSRPSVDSYFKLIYDGKTQQAESYYNRHYAEDPAAQDVIQTRAAKEIQAIVEEYRSRSLDYDSASAQLAAYRVIPCAVSDCLSATAKVVNLKKSGEAFLNAQEYDKRNDLESALSSYSSVAEDDLDYQTAAKRIAELKPLYTAEMLKLADAQLAAKEYQKAAEAVEQALRFDPDSAALKEKKTAITQASEAAKKAAEKARVDAMYQAQPVIVTSCASRNEGYTPGKREAVVIMKNKSGKKIKELAVAILLFDKNGNPLKDQEYCYQENLTLMRYNRSVNAGVKFGGTTYWVIPKNATQIKACVASVEYSDGTSWANEEYYEYWYNTEQAHY